MNPYYKEFLRCTEAPHLNHKYINWIHRKHDIFQKDNGIKDGQPYTEKQKQDFLIWLKSF